MTDLSKGNFYQTLKNDPNRSYIIATVALREGGNKERALALIRAAKWAGADAVSFCLSPGDPNPFDRFDLLFREAGRIGLDFMSPACDAASAGFLSSEGVNAVVVSAEAMTDRRLVEQVGRTGKPVLFATGGNTAENIKKALDWMKSQSNTQVALLHTPPVEKSEPEALNLNAVQFLRDRFGVLIGFSDCCEGPLASIVAVSLGAQIIERRFIIERTEAPEDAASMDARTFKAHVQQLRSIAAMVGRSSSGSSEQRRTALKSRSYEMRSLHGRRWQGDSLSRLH